MRRLNRYVEEQAPWQLAKDDARAGDLDRVLRTLAEGMRCVTVLLWPYLPASCRAAARARSARRTCRSRARRSARARSSSVERAASRCFPKDRAERRLDEGAGA